MPQSNADVLEALNTNHPQLPNRVLLMHAQWRRTVTMLARGKQECNRDQLSSESTYWDTMTRRHTVLVLT
jgi:hypothetical protein